jgi:hypothetical protein
MKKFCVYEHLFPNGKMYFGITSKEPHKRWENGTGYDKSHQPVMYNAIQKYGWDNIKHFILYKNLTYDDACKKEMELIQKYKTNCKKYGDTYGYNMTDGGEGALGHVVSKESRLIMSQRQLGKKGKRCPNSKVVICDGVEYESLTQFKQMNEVKGAVNAWLCGKKGMPIEWYNKGLRYKNQEDKSYPQQAQWSYKIKCNGKIYNSQAELARYLNIAPSIVCCWLNGKNKIPNNINIERIK